MRRDLRRVELFLTRQRPTEKLVRFLTLRGSFLSLSHLRGSCSIHNFSWKRVIFVYPKNSEHIMPYQFPFVIFPDWAKIFFCVLISLPQPQNYNKKNVHLYVCLSVFVSYLVCAGFEVFRVVRLLSNFIYGLREWSYIGVFPKILVFPPPGITRL